jgi:hypothetical protein
MLLKVLLLMLWLEKLLLWLEILLRLVVLLLVLSHQCQLHMSR